MFVLLNSWLRLVGDPTWAIVNINLGAQSLHEKLEIKTKWSKYQLST